MTAKREGPTTVNGQALGNSAQQQSTKPMRRPLPPGYSPLDRGPMGTEPFTQVANAVFRDSRLSAKAMGVFAHLSTHQDGYGVCPESIARHMTDGVSAIKGALRELEVCGYLVRTRARRPDGTLGQARWWITDFPEEEAASAA